MSARRYTHSGLLVPYVAAWSAETAHAPTVVRHQTGHGIGFADEGAYDRDADGVLWIRQPIARGSGRPLFPTVHALRQRRAVSRMLCQVCGADTLEQNPERQLFVLKDIGRPVGEGELTTAAPVRPRVRRSRPSTARTCASTSRPGSNGRCRGASPGSRTTGAPSGPSPATTSPRSPTAIPPATGLWPPVRCCPSTAVPPCSRTPGTSCRPMASSARGDRSPARR